MDNDARPDKLERAHTILSQVSYDAWRAIEANEILWSANQDAELSGGSEAVSDEEIDRLIDAEAEAEHQQELDKLAGLRAELDSLKQPGEKQK